MVSIHNWEACTFTLIDLVERCLVKSVTDVLKGREIIPQSLQSRPLPFKGNFSIAHNKIGPIKAIICVHVHFHCFLLLGDMNIEYLMRITAQKTRHIVVFELRHISLFQLIQE